MRLLLFSDVHRNLATAQKLVELSRDVDVVIGAGDFATDRQGLPEIIGVLAAIEHPSILVPGNAESYEELVNACKAWPAAKVLHGSGTEIDGIKFWGVGGAIPVTTFGASSYDFSEDEGRHLLDCCPYGAILVSHSPPSGILDQSSSGQRFGSVAILETIKVCQPALVVCGHNHSSSGRSEMFENTRVINAGPNGFVWEV